MKYLDNLPEEQEREITMKSSSIALLYLDKSEDAVVTTNESKSEQNEKTEPVKRNLIL